MTTPIGTGNRQQLDSLDGSCGHQVRTPAKVGECTLGISRDMTIFQLGNQLTFVGLASFTKHLQGISLGNIPTDQCLLLGCQFRHLRFNGRKVRLLDDGFARIYIIVETIFNCRSDTELDARIEFLQRFGKQVGACMPESMLTFLIVPFVEHDRSIVLNRTRQVVSFAIHSASQHILCQPRTYTFCYLQAGYPFVILTNGTIRKSYFYHSSMNYF